MDTYPVTFAVDYPERPLDRLTTFFRIFTVIPIAIVITAITGFTTSYDDVGEHDRHGHDRGHRAARSSRPCC